MTKQTPGERWEQRTEWPLALVAIAFLIIYSIEVLSRPHGHEGRVLWAVGWIAWSLFVIDYLVRWMLAADHRQWFLCHLVDLLIVALPVMRPLRLLRLVVLVGALQKAIGNAVRGRILIYTISGVVLLIYVGSLAILDQERTQPGGSAVSASSVWSLHRWPRG
ncbi:ion transport protein [Mycobacterium haemophilum DSM 44634]